MNTLKPAKYLSKRRTRKGLSAASKTADGLIAGVTDEECALTNLQNPTRQGRSNQHVAYPAGITTAGTLTSVYALASDATTKDDRALVIVSSLLFLELGITATFGLTAGQSQRQAFEHAIDGIVIAPLPSAPRTPPQTVSSTRPNWNGAGVFVQGHF